jgi:hypothetical protein
MKKIAFAAFVVAIVGVVGIAQAADKNDPTGTWKWKSKFGKGDNAKEFERSMKLQLKDGKLTGTVSGFGKAATDTKIEDGTFKDGELSFTTTTERKGNKITSKYTGKLSDDTIKGSITTDFNGKENKQDWEAKREGKKKD